MSEQIQIFLTTTGTQGSIVLADLGGLTIQHPTVDLELTDENNIIALIDSTDLYNAINDGHITLKNQYGSDIPSNRNPSVFNAASINGVGIDPTNMGHNRSLTFNQVTGKLGYAAQGVGRSFGSDVIDNNITTLVTWSVTGNFIFDGGTPTEFKGIVRSSNPSTGAALRLYDATNGNVIAITPYSTSTFKNITSTTTFSNLPSGEAIFEVQIAISNPGAGREGYFYGFSLIY